MTTRSGGGFQVRRLPDERLPQIELMPILAHRNPMHGLFEADITLARQRIRDHRARSGTQLSFTAFVIGCLARAINEAPQVQAFRKGRSLVIFDSVDVATLIEADAGEGPVPVVHVVRDAASKPLEEIHNEIRQAQTDRSSVPRVRRQVRLVRRMPRPLRLVMWRLLAKSPQARRRYGGTAVVTSVGMFRSGPGWGVALVGHPVHLTVGGSTRRPIMIDGAVEEREYACLTITLDHEVVDGGPAVRFGARLRELIEQGHGLPQDSLTRASAPSPSG